MNKPDLFKDDAPQNCVRRVSLTCTNNKKNDLNGNATVKAIQGSNGVHVVLTIDETMLNEPPDAPLLDGSESDVDNGADERASKERHTKRNIKAKITPANGYKYDLFDKKPQNARTNIRIGSTKRKNIQNMCNSPVRVGADCC